ncbi:MAG: hypothetical protein RQ756_01845 [Flavobacteriaceae bacterium]|nr:hypothetical protein [Flavobacteriaceae bacterium]
MKTVTKLWLETKVNELNDWLCNPMHQEHPARPLKTHHRNYYVCKLVECDEFNINTVTI